MVIGRTNSTLAAAFLAACLGSSALTPAWAQAAPGADQQVLEFAIEAQSLQTALLEFSRQSDTPVIAPAGLTSGRVAPAVEGRMGQAEALNTLLAGTGLFAVRGPGGGWAITNKVAQDPQGGSAAGGGAEVEALVVTAQKKEEAIQDVPIAISAFTQKSLDAQKLEGGFDLLKAIPNVTFSKNNFNGYNFSIRGIGTKAVSATTDPGVAVSFNNTTLIVNRLFEQEYFDVERVEVLRGPQGTLYGRNATSGVINVLSARPRLGEFEGEVKLEGGNYNAKRVKAMVNVPVGDTLAVRLAGAMTQRKGYGINLAAEDPIAGPEVTSDVDDRDLWSARLTVGWEPIEAIRVNALWEHFEEDDARVRTSKQLCHKDPGDSQVGDYDFDTVPLPTRTFVKATTSQGCLPGSLYDEGAFGTPNGTSIQYIAGMFWGPGFGGDNYTGVNRFWYDANIGGPFFGLPVLEPSCPEGAEFPVAVPIDVCNADPYAGLSQVQDLRTIYSLLQPTYRAKADIFEVSIDIDLSDEVTFTSQTVFNRDSYYATQDYNRFTTGAIFSDSNLTCQPLSLILDSSSPNFGQCMPGTYLDNYYNRTPGGVFTDPQLGPSDKLVAQDLSQAESEQFNQEFRLVSNFDAPLNFSLGSNFTRFETQNDYFVFINAATLLTYFFPFNTLNPDGTYGNFGVGCRVPDDGIPVPCVYVDPNPLESINGEGHNYFRSDNPYQLTSSALFGEVYWQMTDTLKLTVGARMTWDKKVFTPIPSQLLLVDYRMFVPEGAGPEACTDGIGNCRFAGTGVGGRGSPPNPDIKQEWREPTGRVIVDWKPDLSFTDDTMIYGSISHGYKGGGANPPGISAPASFFNNQGRVEVVPPVFEPEFVNAVELGTKNTLMGGGLILNGALFHYDYENYQVSKIVDRTAANENFDARVWGAELEWVFSPTRNLRFNGTLGYLQTSIGNGEQSIDLMDRAQGTDATFGEFTGWMVLKPGVASTSNCVAPIEVVEEYLTNVGNDLSSLCPVGNLLGFKSIVTMPDGRVYDPGADAPNGGAGFYVDLSEHELPNAPHWTMSLGAQYSLDLPAGWRGTFRADHYWQDKSFARVYNTEYDRLQAWQNTNFSLWFEQRDWGVKAEVYVKNAFDEEPITDAFLNSDDSGLTTNIFTLDPRLVGVSVTKTF